MGLFQIPFFRTQSRHGAEPMDDISTRFIQNPTYSKSVFPVLNYIEPNVLLVIIYTLFILGQVQRKLVRLTPRVLIETVLLNILAFAFTLDILNRAVGFILLLAFICYVNSHLASEYLAVENKAVIITGCDRGFGHALAKRLDKIGFRVYAGCLDKTGEGADNLVQECSDKLTVLQLDVTRDDDVILAAERVESTLGDSKLWGIVNNAGICLAGNSELVTMEDTKKVMEVNFWGPVRICKAFLPLVRRERGRVVNVASNAGLAPIPLMGGYCASKAALSTMSEIWRSELQAWGVKVSTIVPSGFNTGILAYDKFKMAEKWYKSASENVKADFGKDAFYVKPRAEGNEEKFLSSNLSVIVDVMVDALLAKSPKACYHRGFLSHLLPFLYNHLPRVLGEPVMRVMGDWFETQTPEALKGNKL